MVKFQSPESTIFKDEMRVLKAYHRTVLLAFYHLSVTEDSVLKLVSDSPNPVSHLTFYDFGGFLSKLVTVLEDKLHCKKELISARLFRGLKIIKARSHHHQVTTVGGTNAIQCIVIPFDIYDTSYYRLTEHVWKHSTPTGKMTLKFPRGTKLRRLPSFLVWNPTTGNVIDTRTHQRTITTISSTTSLDEFLTFSADGENNNAEPEHSANADLMDDYMWEVKPIFSGDDKNESAEKEHSAKVDLKDDTVWEQVDSDMEGIRKHSEVLVEERIRQASDEDCYVVLTLTEASVVLNLLKTFESKK